MTVGDGGRPRAGTPRLAVMGVVGASARGAVCSVLRAGKRAVAADLFADVDLARQCSVERISPYPEGLADWLAQTECDGWLYTGALENYPELVDRMAEMRPLLGNDGRTLQAVRSPERLANVLHGARLLFPETRTSAEGLPYDGSWLMKSYRGSCGSGVREFDATRQENEQGGFYQRRVAGMACSAVFVGNGRESALLGVTRQLLGESWAGASAFQYCGSIGPLPLGSSVKAEVVRIGDVLAASFGLRGLFGVDLMIDGNEAWTIEVNPRYTAAVEVIERASGLAAIDAHIAGCRGKTHRQTRAASQENFFGKAIVFCRQPTVVAQAFVDWALQPKMADIPQAGTSVAPGQPVLTAFAEGGSATAVQDELRQCVAEVEQRLYRKDERRKAKGEKAQR